MNSSLPGAIRAVRTAALSALLFAAAASAQTAAASTAGTDLATYADRLFTETYPADEPGAAVLIVQDGKTVLRKGYGMANLELGVPIQPEMVFEIGSVTKQFTAAAILKLAERGKLALEDDVTQAPPRLPRPTARRSRSSTCSPTPRASRATPACRSGRRGSAKT